EPGNEAWNAARDRANQLSTNRNIAVRALGLGSEGKAGADLVSQVFPKTEVVQLSGDQLGQYLAQEAGNAKRRVLADAVRNEIAAGSVSAKVEAPEGLESEVPAKVTLTNGLPHLGVDVDLKLVTAVDNNGKPVRVSIVDGSRIIHLAPAGTATFEALVKPDVEPGPLFQLPPPEREELDITLKLDGTAVALPTEIIRKDLGVDPAVKVTAPDQFTVGRDVGTTWLQFLIRIVLFFLAVALVVWFWLTQVRRRRLSGIFYVDDDHQLPLRGKSMTVNPAALGMAPGTPQLRLYTKMWGKDKVFHVVDGVAAGHVQRDLGDDEWGDVERGGRLSRLAFYRIGDNEPFQILAK
ncbi:MAG: hypothetical protein ACOYOQ_16605, partial [Microthrixaceae bacterium]